MECETALTDKKLAHPRQCPMLMQGQQVEMFYMGIEDSKNALKKTMDFITNPSSSSAGLVYVARVCTESVLDSPRRPLLRLVTQILDFIVQVAEWIS